MKFKDNKLILENGKEKEIPVSRVRIEKHIDDFWNSSQVNYMSHNYHVGFSHGEVSHEPIQLRESSDYIYDRMCIVRKLGDIVGNINLVHRRIKDKYNSDRFYKSSNHYEEDIKTLNKLEIEIRNILKENNLEVKDREVWMFTDEIMGLVVGDKLCIKI